MTLLDYKQRTLSSAGLDRYVLLLWGLAVFGLSVTAHGQSVAVIHCQGECPAYESPVTANQSQVVVHHLYAAGVNGRTSLPDWVAYRLTGNAVGVASLLPRAWQADRLVRFSPLEDIAQAGEEELRLSEMIAENSSPYGGGAGALVKPEDRARLAPITSFANTPYWSELNNFSNMVPMPASLRLGPWLQLEQRLNRLVAGDRELYVLAGPLYLTNILSLSPSSADLEPAAYFKLVADEKGIAAFMFASDADRFSNVCAGRVSLAEIQEMSDLNYYPGQRRVRESESLYKELGCQVAVDEADFTSE